MNILLVNMSLDRVTGGGTVERVLKLHAAMGRIGEVSPRILSIGDSRECGGEGVCLLPCLNRRWHVPVPVLPVIIREVRRADVILLMNHWTVLNAIVYWVARLYRKPYVVCPAGALEIFGRSKGFKRFYQMVVGRAMLVHAGAAIAIAADERKTLERNGVHGERIRHIANGIDPVDFDDDGGRFRRDPVQENEYILFVGRLNAIKGPDLLLQAFIRLADDFPGLHLVFAGPDGGLQQELTAMADRAGVGDRVHFIGFVADRKKAAVYHGASMLVVPSRQEAMSIVALEGAICAVPVILTDRCGFDELEDAGAAFVVSPEPPALAEAIACLMRQPALRRRMGKAGKHFVAEHYTWQQAARRHIVLFRQLLQERR